MLTPKVILSGGHSATVSLTSGHVPSVPAPTVHAPTVTVHAPAVTAPTVHAPTITVHAPPIAVHAPTITVHAPLVTVPTVRVPTVLAPPVPAMHVPPIPGHAPSANNSTITMSGPVTVRLGPPPTAATVNFSVYAPSYGAPGVHVPTINVATPVVHPPAASVSTPTLHAPAVQGPQTVSLGPAPSASHVGFSFFGSALATGAVPAGSPPASAQQPLDLKFSNATGLAPVPASTSFATDSNHATVVFKPQGR